MMGIILNPIYTIFVQCDSVSMIEKRLVGHSCKRTIVVKNHITMRGKLFIKTVYDKLTLTVYYSTYRYTKR